MTRIFFIDEDAYMVGSRGVIRRVNSLKSSPMPCILSVMLVLEGKWDDSITILREIGVSPETKKCATFVILEQKFLEHLQSGNTKDALLTLKNEISPGLFV
uniref:CTLH domain-containing protein n=1 Tax=Chenopodium quinoa TaxID=63459 RepID=A0A803MNP2_CHEQI